MDQYLSNRIMVNRYRSGIEKYLDCYGYDLPSDVPDKPNVGSFISRSKGLEFTTYLCPEWTLSLPNLVG